MRFLFFLFFIATMAFSQDSHRDWKRLDDKRYSICYPNTIELDMSSMMQSTFVLFFPIEKEGLFRTNINLLIQDLKQAPIETLEDFYHLSEKQIKQLVTKSEILDSKKIMINDIEFYKIIFTGIQNQYFLKWAQYYAIKDKIAYVLTFTSTINQFDYYEKIQDEIVATFKLK